jgi:hypothetical protein
MTTEYIIAVTHPGLRGDLLYALPAARHLCAGRGTRCDIYTSESCRNLTNLLLYQSFVRRVVIPPEYRATDAACGVQPWLMPVPMGDYAEVWHLGYRSTPDRPLPDWIASQAGLPEGLPVTYEVPAVADRAGGLFAGRYVVLARLEPLADELARFAEACPLPVVQVGAAGEALPSGKILDRTGCDYLWEAAVLSRAVAYVGPPSSHLALANGWPVMKVCVHDGRGDARHLLRGPHNHYLEMPRAEQILEYVNSLG